MSRVKRGILSKKRHKGIIKKAKGYYSARSRTFKSAKQSVLRAYQYSYRDRKVKKRDFRKLWIVRINAAVRKFGLSYNDFINKLKKNLINLNRKTLNQIILNDINSFEKIICFLDKKI